MIHLRPYIKPKLKADTYALKEARIRIRKQLENELAEERMSRGLVDKRNARLRASQQFHLTGEKEH